MVRDLIDTQNTPFSLLPSLLAAANKNHQDIDLLSEVILLMEEMRLTTWDGAKTLQKMG